MAKYNESSLPLYEKIRLKPTFQRVKDSLILALLLLILGHRVFSYSNYDTLPWVVAFICELWFTYTWVLTFCIKWSPAFNKTYPHRLLQRMPEDELPAIDLLVTTADPVLEPPIITVNTVLSLLALQYPTYKLACYVSDDGCSPHTFFALVEASKFAKIWVPFCKNNNVQVRAPFRYFSDESTATESPEFQQEWLKMKDEYEHLCRKIEDAIQKWIPSELDAEYEDFKNTEKQNHPAIIKIIWENKEGLSDGVPHLIYISREKQPKHPHHYKAGAMNVLLKVSGLMTNAPFTLNVDCDMFVNNPNIAIHAMCILLDSKSQNEVAFVQCPQQFNDTLKDDPLGNQLLSFFKFMADRIAGLQGPMYVGTNCFHRREVLYGVSPDDIGNDKKVRLSETDLIERFGSLKELVKSAVDAFEGKTYSSNPNLSESLGIASQVAGCQYENGTGWGKQVGLLYGSTVEDILAGLTIHRRGWRSEGCAPEPIAFTGCPPGDFPSTMSQQKRWAQGHVEILLSKHSPVLAFLFGKLQFRMCLAYLWINWGIRSIPELCYAALPAYCIISNSCFLPKGQSLWIHVILVVGYHMHTLSEYIESGQSIREWWNNKRMERIKATNAWLFGFIIAILKLLGITQTVFEITQKGQSSGGEDASDGRYTFDGSPIIVPGTTLLLLHLTALSMSLLGLQPAAVSGKGFGLGEVLCSAYWVICYWPFLKGLFENGKYGIPSSTIFKSALIAFVFVTLCRNPLAG